MTDEIGEFIWQLLGGAFVLLIVAVLFTTIANTGLAPEQGDPFYVAWLDITRYGWQALLWIVPGVGGAAYLVFRLVDDAEGF